MRRVVHLDWPDKRLSPNARVHWAVLHKLKQRAKHDAIWSARAAVLPIPETRPLPVVVEFHPPDKRHRDLDNMLASLKAALDGVALVWGVDDSQWTLELHRGEPNPLGGCVWVWIKQEDGDGPDGLDGPAT